MKACICDSMDAPWGIKLSEVNWTGKDMHYDFIYMWNLKNKPKNKPNKTETEL